MTDVVEGPSSEPQDEPEVSQDGASPDSGEEADESQPGPIPYDRFKEINDAKNAEAEARAAAEARANQLQGQLQQASQMIEAARQQPVAQPKEDPNLALARSKFGQDEVGQQTFDAVRTVAEAILASRGETLTEAKVAEIAQQAAGGVRQELNSGMAMTNEINSLTAQNNLTQKEAQIFQRTLGSMMQDPQFAASAKNPQNVPWIVKGALMDLARDGKVKLGRQPRSQPSVLQPGGNGLPPNVPEVVKASDIPIPDVAEFSEERLAELYAMSQANHKEAMG